MRFPAPLLLAPLLLARLLPLALTALPFTALPLTAMAQEGWPNLDPALFQHLARKPEHVEAAYFLPDHPDPAKATEALGFAYEWIEGSAGSVSISVGYFTIEPSPLRLTFHGPIADLYGNSPHDPAFFPDRIEVSMTTLKEDDPRCCPTGETRYTIDRTTRTATKLWTR